MLTSIFAFVGSSTTGASVAGASVAGASVAGASVAGVSVAGASVAGGSDGVSSANGNDSKVAVSSTPSLAQPYL